MNTKAKTARSDGADGVHTSAQPETLPGVAPAKEGCTGCGGCGGGCAGKPAHHKPTALAPRDKYTGMAGSFVRDPVTGERKPVTETEG